MSVRNLEHLFNPQSVAVVGASERERSIGETVLRNLRAAGFAGTIFPVNPRHSEVGGMKCYASVAKLPATPDLAVICTPLPTVPALVDELGKRGAKAAIVITPGPGKADPERAPFTRAMLAAAKPHLLRILGPDSLGLLVPGLGLNASAAPTPALPGKITFVSQSGALGAAVLDWAHAQRIGFAKFVSLGVGADIDLGDVLDYFADDGDTHSILLHVESIAAARKFMSAARAAARNKPVLMLKAGRTPEGAIAAALHTGAIVGADEVYDAAIRRAGMLRVFTTEDLFDAVETLGRARAQKGDRLAIVTNGGGPGVMATDALIAKEGRLAALTPDTLRRLDALLPEAWSHANPVDIVGDAPAARYAQALEIVLQDEQSDAALLIHAPTATVASAEVAQGVLPLFRATHRSVFACWLGGDAELQARAAFIDAGIPTFDAPEKAVRGFLQVAWYHRNQQLLMEIPPSRSTDFPHDAQAALDAVTAALAAGREWLSGSEARAVLTAFGIPVVADSDEGVPNVERSGARELMVSAAADAVFGPVILFGLGGVTGEIEEDRAVGLPPLNQALALDLVERTRVARLLRGYGDHPAADLDAVARTLVQVSHLIAHRPEIVELHIDPLLADAKGVVARQARIRVAASGGLGMDRFAIKPYPEEFEEWVTWQERPLLLRPIRPEDGAQHMAFFHALDPEDVRFRVFGFLKELQSSQLARLTQIDYDREMAFIATREAAPGRCETLGVVRAVADPDNISAQFAIIVRSDLKGLGLGRLLMARIVDYCTRRGTREMTGEALSDNHLMLDLARHFGFTLSPPRDGVVEMVRPLGAQSVVDGRQCRPLAPGLA
jgi:acetyltransferase